MSHRLYPLKNKRVWEWYKLHKSTFWTADEIDFSEDKQAFQSLQPQEQYFILRTVAFFAGSDILVNEMISRNEPDIVGLENKIYYTFKQAIENIHTETYAEQIVNICDEKQANEAFESIKNDKVIKAKADWFRKWIKDDNPIKRSIASAIMEGIYFSSSFCSIFWIKKRGIKMNGLVQSNELISRDEGLHRNKECDDFQHPEDYFPPNESFELKPPTQEEVEKYNRNDNKDNKESINEKDTVEKAIPTNAYIIEMIKDAVKIEVEFARTGLPVDLIGINKDLMEQYIYCVADDLCIALINKTIYNAKNPFDWCTTMAGLSVNTNFFEKRVTNYQKPQDSGPVTFDKDF